MTTLKTAEQIQHEWTTDPRWAGITRNYTAQDVVRLRGTIPVEHSIAKIGAEKLWRYLHELPFVNALGALTGNQAMQQVRAGLKAIYLSGWQVAGDANNAGEMYPDQSLYPADSVPAVVRRINNTLLRADQICPLPPEVDFETAGALPVAGVTAWMSLVEIGRLQPGQRALILGAAGGVGQFAVQLARHTLGAFSVGVCSGANAALVRGLGANAVLDYTQGDALAQARSHAPYQVVMDCVGTYSGAGCRS